MELRWLRNVVKRVSFICFSFLVLCFVKQLLVKLERIFVSRGTRSACVKLLSSFAISMPVLKSSRLSPLSWFLHIKQAPVIIIFSEIITIIWLFWIFAFSSYPVVFVISLISNPKQQEQLYRKTCKLRTNSQQIERFYLTSLQKFRADWKFETII